jgi:alpha/beta superfamily hydrolase
MGRRLPGARDVRATLDGGDADSVVVACPPHPQFGGDRRDARLRAVSDALADRGVSCLRIDYGAWSGGEREVGDAETALDWAGERYGVVGLFGYSFGAGVALVAGETVGESPAAVSVLAPPARLGERETVPAVESIERLHVVYGERDDTVDWQPVVERARECDATVERVPADHFFVGQRARVAEAVADFLA